MKLGKVAFIVSTLWLMASVKSFDVPASLASPSHEDAWRSISLGDSVGRLSECAAFADSDETVVTVASCRSKIKKNDNYITMNGSYPIRSVSTLTHDLIKIELARSLVSRRSLVGAGLKGASVIVPGGGATRDLAGYIGVSGRSGTYFSHSASSFGEIPIGSPIVVSGQLIGLHSGVSSGKGVGTLVAAKNWVHSKEKRKRKSTFAFAVPD